jgi:ArsR family transcriptional regulator
MKTAQTDSLWQDRAAVLRAMAHPVRLMILEALCEQPKCVKDINSLIPIVQAHLSQHIAALRRAKLIDRHVSGPLRCYYVVRPTLVKRIIRLLSQEHPLRLQDRRVVVRAAGGCESTGAATKGSQRPPRRRRLPAGDTANR